MVSEIIKYLNIKKNGIYVDCTCGDGGHSKSILKKLGPDGILFIFDLDKKNLQNTKIRLKKYKNVHYINKNFIYIQDVLKKYNIDYVNGIIADIGFCSSQIDNPDRGFSYKKNASLDMRYDVINNQLLAKNIINEFEENKLINIFKKYGEERFSKLIVKKILLKRKESQIKTSFELNEIIKSSIPIKFRLKKHPSRKIFQALRIYVNSELKNLEKLVTIAPKIIKKFGLFLIISFHSLEDRIIKKKFASLTKNKINNKLPVFNNYYPKFKLISKSIIIPTKKEIMNNSRAKNAKLRGLIKI